MRFEKVNKRTMIKIAKIIANRLQLGDILLLYGNLGSGKTYFTGKVCKSLGVKTIVNSPSFVLLNEYEGNFKINHYDLYRLVLPEEALEIGVLDKLNEGITIIEWPDLIKDFLPEKAIEIYIEHNEDLRNIEILNFEGDCEIF